MNRLKHLTKSVTEAYLFRYNRIIDLTAFRVAHAHSVDHVIIRIEQRDRAVEIRQKNILGITVLGRRHGGQGSVPPSAPRGGEALGSSSHL